ncbi:MAG: hypothetical protein WCG83_05175 [Candidatus Peregrinibacteria bacterium]
MVDMSTVLLGLWIAVAVLVLIVLYHLIFIAVDLRKIFRRFEDITREVEGVIMKPLSMADKILEWLVEMVESHQKKAIKHPKKEA